MKAIRSDPDKLDDLIRNRLAVPDAISLPTDEVRIVGMYQAVERSLNCGIAPDAGANRSPAYSQRLENNMFIVVLINTVVLPRSSHLVYRLLWA